MVLALCLLREIPLYLFILLVNHILAITLSLIDKQLFVIRACLIPSSASEKAVAHGNTGTSRCGVQGLMLPFNQVIHEETHVEGLGLRHDALLSTVVNQAI